MRPAPRAVAVGRALVLLLLGASLSASAYTVRRVVGSLKDVPSTFTPATNAPRSEWRPAGVPGALDNGGPSSKLAPANVPSTVFRVAEVPAARVAITQELLTSLKAQQTDRQAIVIALPADVLFDFDKADLRPDALASLEKASELLKSYPAAPVEVHGHTDGKGTDGYNDALSTRRAEAVAARLQPAVEGGRRVAVAGHGKRQPVAPNVHGDGSDDPEGRQRNRRVEIIIQPPAMGERKS